MKLKLTEFVPEKNPKNKWIIIYSWMSGDGDHYQEEEYTFKTREEFIEYVTLFNEIEGMDSNCKTFKEKVKGKLDDIPYDITSDGIKASPNGIDEMFYFDKDGKKFVVTIE